MKNTFYCEGRILLLQLVLIKLNLVLAVFFQKIINGKCINRKRRFSSTHREL